MPKRRKNDWLQDNNDDLKLDEPRSKRAKVRTNCSELGEATPTASSSNVDSSGLLSPVRSNSSTNGHEEASSKQTTFSASNYKYWAQRYRFFSRFAEGIQLDDEGWFSVTPELIAAHIAERVWASTLRSFPPVPRPLLVAKSSRSKKVQTPQATPLLLDAFCGAGGNAIQFARTVPESSLVFAVDIDPNRIKMAQHNAGIYGVASRIEFVLADSLRLPTRLGRAMDAIFLSPPWGGPDYIHQEYYDLASIQPIPGDAMVRHYKAMCPNIALLVPRNVKQAQLFALADPGAAVEVEGNYLTGKLKTVTAYYGSLVNTDDKEEVIHARSEEDMWELPWTCPLPARQATDEDQDNDLF